LGRIKVPTLVLVGDTDELTPPSHAQEIAAGIKDAELVVVAKCGHLSTLERPEAVTAALVDLMTR
jgi:pimeloyl-ACP methyl ester carboxylesterase